MNVDLKHIIRMQTVDTSIMEVRGRIDKFPGISKKLDERLKDATAGLEAAKESVKNNLASRKKFESDVAAQQAKISKYREQMLSVKTNQEYKALQQEIEHAETAIRKIEDEILNLMESFEASQNEVKDAESRLKLDQQAVNVDRKALEEENKKDKSALDGYVTERKQAETGLTDDSLLTRYERIRKARGGIAVAAARDYVCDACKVRIRPQVFQEIRKNDQLISCDACQRILYNPDNMDHPFEVV